MHGAAPYSAVIAPRYLNGTANDALYEGAFDTNTTATVGCFKAEQTVGFFHQVKDGVDFVFVDHPSYKREGGLYGDKFGVYGGAEPGSTTAPGLSA